MGNSNEKKVEYKKGKVEKNYFSKIDTIMSMKNCTNFSLINNLKICLNEKKLVKNSFLNGFKYNHNGKKLGKIS